MYKVVDLFSGAGGLSLGFEKTGLFRIVAAFENNPNARKTYKKNNDSVEMYENVCEADYKELRNRFGEIDIVIGGPPCQGFSNANRQKNYAISQNNMLVKEYIRAIIELQPKGFLMENVGMLKSSIHIFYMTNKDSDLVRRYNLKVHNTHIVLIDQKYIYPELKKNIRDIEFVNTNMWNMELYKLISNIYRHKNNVKKLKNTVSKHKTKILESIRKFCDQRSPDLNNISIADNKSFKAIQEYIDGADCTITMLESVETSLMYQRMLGKSKELIENDILVKEIDDTQNLIAKVDSISVYDYLITILGSEKNGYIIDSGILNAADFGVPQKRKRFIVMGVKKSLTEVVKLPKSKIGKENYTTVRDAIQDLEEKSPVYTVQDDIGIVLDHEVNLCSLAKRLNDTKLIKNHIITESSKIALERFAAIGQGQNFHSLDISMKENTYSDTSRTQNTIYLRISYDQPSGTVVNVRKSMWIHPILNRAISVREAARLQTFPDSYVFIGTKDSQYQQVGNAVPPMFAYELACCLASQIK